MTLVQWLVGLRNFCIDASPGPAWPLLRSAPQRHECRHYELPFPHFFSSSSLCRCTTSLQPTRDI
ncbi:MAG: hypothetical protein M3Z24_00665 [Chloroflexota bacterium]|nr:hypothetical protein [Chloroflexota bacterium]